MSHTSQVMEMHHFSAWEFRCRCQYNDCNHHAGYQPPAELVHVLEYVRAAVNDRYRNDLPKEIGINILSGIRCVKHNRDEGGAQKSQHLLGIAADIHCNAVPAQVLYDILAASPFADRIGLAVYRKSNFVHVDVRGYCARWKGD